MCVVHYSLNNILQTVMENAKINNRNPLILKIIFPMVTPTISTIDTQYALLYK